MSRRCENCGFLVSVGNGKWLGDTARPETLIVVHKRPELCAKSKYRSDASRERALEHGLGHRKALDTCQNSKFRYP